MKRIGKKTRRIKKRMKNIQKNKTMKRKYLGGTIIGIGKDGCIIDSFSCNDFSNENGYVSKFFFDSKKINKKLNKKLEKIDPNNERYNRYYLPDLSNCIKNENYNDDFLNCSKKGKINTLHTVFQKKLEPFDEKNMSKKQYRYLRKSLQLLHDNNISHGDLPTNVMLNPIDNMPIIIDWEDAKDNADYIDKQIDMNAFLNHYKVGK